MDKLLYVPAKRLLGALPILLLGISILLSGWLYRAYPDLPPTCLPKTEEARYLLRLLITLIPPLLGMFASIISLAYTINKLKTKIQSTNNYLITLRSDLTKIKTLVAGLEGRITDLRSKE